MDFDSAFETLTGFRPLRWQQRLYADFFSKGDIPAALDLPTGLGKTSVMAIWLIARALGDDAARKKLPRRLVYIVDRRAVVDQATALAEKLREALDAGARALKAPLGLAIDAKLPISTLRGQHADNREWLVDPASPAVIVGTVDMIGSRLLFEGYGVSRRMRPYHAGLLGADTLVVLDEAHLVPPFAHLLRSIERGVDNAADVARHDHLGPRGDARKAIIPRFALLPLSATQRNIGASKTCVPFRLTEADEDETTRRRLDAGKRLTLLELDEGKKAAEALAEKAFELATKDENRRRVVVFCDRRDATEDESIAAAQGVREELEKLAKGDKKAGRERASIDLQLMVGARRVKEREDVARWLAECGFLGEKKNLENPAILIATSAGEVGVDIDADHMVSDLVAWERMVQRLGRVNRRGEGNAEVVAFWSSPKAPNRSDSTTPAERRAIVAANAKAVLECLPASGDYDGRDASPRALQQLSETAQRDDHLKGKIAAATTPEPLRPALNRALVDAWSMTSLEAHAGRPEVAPWLRGWIDDDKPQTTVVWRRHLPVRIDEDRKPVVPDKDKMGRDARAYVKAINGFFEAAPPHQSEKLETETFRVVEWLCARAAAVSKRPAAEHNSMAEPDADADKAESDAGEVVEYNEESLAENKTSLRPDEIVALTLTPADEFAKACSLRELAASGDKKAKEALNRDLAGKTLVVDARIGGLAGGLLDGRSSAAVQTADDGCELSLAPPRESETPEPLIKFRVSVSTPTETDAIEDQSSATNDNWSKPFEFTIEFDGEGNAKRSLIVEKWRDASTSENEKSISKRSQSLSEHQSWTETRATAIALGVGLGKDHAKVLAIAARLHDEGKARELWQRAMGKPRPSRAAVDPDWPYAKTGGRGVNLRLLQVNGETFRHEFASINEAEKNNALGDLSNELRDLALHLVAAHHGFARPVIAAIDPDAPPSALQERAQEVALRFARLQKQWGPWGLAWLEALLRAADAQASRENDERAAEGGGA